MGYVYPPVPIDGATGGKAPPNPLESGQVVTGPFVHGANLFAFLQTPTLAGTCEVFKSTDNGVSWANVDPGGSSAGITFSCWFDGINTVRIAFCGDTTSDQPLQVQDFDLVSETWQPPVPGGPNARNVLATVILSTGDTLVIYFISASPGFFFGAILSGGLWGIAFPIDTNAQALGSSIFGQSSNSFSYTMDAAGLVMHACFGWQRNPSFKEWVIYQQINFDGTLGPFTVFPDVQISPVNSTPIIYGTFVVIAFAGPAGQSLQIGSPISNPVFSEADGIDPGFPADPNLTGQYPGEMIVSAGVLTLIYIVQGTGGTQNNRLRLLQTNDILNPAAGWSGQTIFDGATQGGPGWTQNDLHAASLNLDVNGNISVGFNSDAIPGPADLIRYWLQNNGVTSPLAIAGNPGPGLVGVAYSSCYSASGGTPPYVFSVSSGFLPPGLSLNPATGCITGTPKLKGVFCFGVTVTDAVLATASSSVCVTINQAFAPSEYGAAKQQLMKPCRTTELDMAKFTRIVESLRPVPLAETKPDPCISVPNWRKR